MCTETDYTVQKKPL